MYCDFAFSYCSWGSQCKNTEVVCHFLLWWTLYHENSLPWPVHFGWPCWFSSSHVRMWELDHKWSWAPKNWCFWTVVLEKTLESPLDSKEILSVNPKGNQSWIFTGKTDAEAETPMLWPPVVMEWLIGKDSDVGKDWRQEERGMTQDEMAGWHHWLDAHEFEQALEVGDGQGSLACCTQWGRKESNTTEQLNWTDCDFGFKVFCCIGKGLAFVY